MIITVIVIMILTNKNKEINTDTRISRINNIAIIIIIITITDSNITFTNNCMSAFVYYASIVSYCVYLGSYQTVQLAMIYECGMLSVSRQPLQEKRRRANGKRILAKTRQIKIKKITEEKTIQLVIIVIPFIPHKSAITQLT